MNLKFATQIGEDIERIKEIELYLPNIYDDVQEQKRFKLRIDLLEKKIDIIKIVTRH